MFPASFATLDTLEREIMTIIWNAGPQTGRDLVVLLRQQRTIALATVTATLARLVERGLLVRSGARTTWRYIPRYPSRGAFLAAALEQLCTEINAGPNDRAEALTVILGVSQ